MLIDNFSVAALKRQIKLQTRLMSGFPVVIFMPSLEPSVEGKECDSKLLDTNPTKELISLLI